MKPHASPPQRIAVVGAGMAGIACARTLLQAGCEVTVFEAAAEPGGRMATQASPWGSFDSGAQYFTVRDARLAQALEMAAPGLVRRWSVSAVRVLDERGRVIEAAAPPREAHWIPVPGMSALARHWATPLAALGRLQLEARVLGARRGHGASGTWSLQVQGGDGRATEHAGFDAIAWALPAPVTRELLRPSAGPLAQALDAVVMGPCWSLMLAFPQAEQPGLQTLGPQWNAARSTHHRLAWLARETAKPQRGGVERWVAQAGHDWSLKHERDDPARVGAKLLKAFGEITGIRAAPGHSLARLWPHARTRVPLGRSHLWDPGLGLGLCGDWCLGQRVEDAFVSGLELALTMHDK